MSWNNAGAVVSGKAKARVLAAHSIIHNVLISSGWVVVEASDSRTEDPKHFADGFSATNWVRGVATPHSWIVYWHEKLNLEILHTNRGEPHRVDTLNLKVGPVGSFPKGVESGESPLKVHSFHCETWAPFFTDFTAQFGVNDSGEFWLFFFGASSPAPKVIFAFYVGSLSDLRSGDSNRCVVGFKAEAPCKTLLDGFFHAWNREGEPIGPLSMLVPTLGHQRREFLTRCTVDYVEGAKLIWNAMLIHERSNEMSLKGIVKDCELCSSPMFGEFYPVLGRVVVQELMFPARGALCW